MNLNINQAAFSSNWKSGGVNSIGLNALFNYQFNYAKDRNSWDNQIDLLYGFVNNSGQGYRKTLDRIFLDTKYGYKLNEKWGLYTSLKFLSQFAEGMSMWPPNVGTTNAPLCFSLLHLLPRHGDWIKASRVFTALSTYSPWLTVVRILNDYYVGGSWSLRREATWRNRWMVSLTSADFNRIS